MTQSCSIYHPLFEFPAGWERCFLVQLCTDSLFERVWRRASQLCASVDVVLRKGSALTLPNSISRHEREMTPSKPFSSYLDFSLFDSISEGSGVIFVYSDLENESKGQRCDLYLDIFEDVYQLNKRLGFAPVAMVNANEYWSSWEEFYSAASVSIPGVEHSEIVSAWIVGDAKNRAIELVQQAASKGPIVEIGRLYGGSAVLFALALKGVSDAAALFSFDPYPHPYNDRFLDLYGVSDQVALCDISSREGAAFWQEQQLPPVTFIHIDGDHRYEAVVQDIDLWYPLLAKGAAIMFDDFGYNTAGLAGSTRAVFESVISRPDRFRDVETVNRALIAFKTEECAL